MLLCPKCKDSQWDVIRYETFVHVLCVGRIKVAEKPEGSAFAECGHSYVMPPWFVLVPTATPLRTDDNMRITYV